MGIKTNTTARLFADMPIIDRVAITVMSIELFTSVTITASLFDKKKLLENKVIVLTGPEYNAWGNSDQYIINITLEKLGLTEKPGLTVTY